jgi:NADH oxidase (H2O2-forming)
LPYVLSGEVKDFKSIFLNDRKFYEDNKITFVNNTEVIEIDKNKKEVIYIQEGYGEKKLGYDKLVICVGSKVAVPKIKGLEKVEYLTFKSIDNAKELENKIQKNKKAVVIGGGAIGIEVAYALSKRGLKVTIIEAKNKLASVSLDSDMSNILEDYLKEQGIKIIENCYVDKIEDNKIIIGKKEIEFDLLIVATGFMVNLELAKKARIKFNKGILVDDYMQTSDKDIYACGDCVETKYFLTNENVISQLGTTALRQVKVVARNLVGEKTKFIPVLNNHISKVGDLHYGSTGANKEFAKKLSWKVITGIYTTKTKPEYYRKGKEITIKLVCGFDGRILGAQMVGYENFADKLNLITSCIKKGLNLDDLIYGEFCYNPCTSNPINELSIVAEICKKKLELNNVT